MGAVTALRSSRVGRRSTRRLIQSLQDEGTSLTLMLRQGTAPGRARAGSGGFTLSDRPRLLVQTIK